MFHNLPNAIWYLLSISRARWLSRTKETICRTVANMFFTSSRFRITSLTHKLIKWSAHPNHPEDVSARYIYLRQSKLTFGEISAYFFHNIAGVRDKTNHFIKDRPFYTYFFQSLDCSFGCVISRKFSGF